MNETEALVVLNTIKGLGNAGIRKLLHRYGSASKILTLRKKDLSDHPVIPTDVIENILYFSKDKFLKTEYNLINKRKVKIVTWLDENYPELLRQIADAPVVLYVKGEVPFSNPLSVAVVGSRVASFYGTAIAEKFSTQLAELGFTVVSGMARGIDTAAHKGALKARGKTVAVLGCGLNHVYPLENMELMTQIAETGTVLSEFPMQTPPVSYNFPRRNRIISGLSTGVIVVEAAQRSGALITADCALEQGRDVYAVPGKIDQIHAQGVNNLIKQGAKLVTSIEDILEDMKPYISTCLKGSEDRLPVSQGRKVSDKKILRLRPSASPQGFAQDEGSKTFKNTPTPQLSKDEKLIFKHITDRPVHVDELIDCCDDTVPVMSILLQLEMKQLVKQLPGKLFVR